MYSYDCSVPVYVLLSFTKRKDNSLTPRLKESLHCLTTHLCMSSYIYVCISLVSCADTDLKNEEGSISAAAEPLLQAAEPLQEDQQPALPSLSPSGVEPLLDTAGAIEEASTPMLETDAEC